MRERKPWHGKLTKFSNRRQVKPVPERMQKRLVNG
jgi:hypothetical protein